jgi:hypothetical protein
MARNITLTLGAGLGADLGPNFNLTANVGSVTPSTATKSELTAGKSVSVDDAATEVTITSTGTCTNAITQTIPCAGETTTTTSTSTTTTTTSGIVCEDWEILNGAFTNVIDYKDCSGNVQQFTLDPGEIVNCFSVDSNAWGTDVPFLSTQPFTQNKCTSTTTTTEPPTTTTTAAITYDNYHADQYDCATCTLQSVDTVIAFPTGTSVTVDKWYAPESLNGYVYRLTSLTPQTGPGLIMLTSEFNSCAFACFV